MATTKKVTKKAAPIDQGETFVSLSMSSKNLGEGDGVAIEEKLHSLYNLQCIDTQIDKIVMLRGELPLEVQDIEDSVEGLKTRIANAEEEIRSAKETVASCNHGIAESKELAAKYQAQRDNVKNNREYESISKEIEYQELQVMACEKRIREANLLTEEKKALIEKTEADLAGLNTLLEAKKKELETIVEETAREEADLTRRREGFLANLDERMVIAYNKVRNSTRNKLAVVTVKEDGRRQYACGGCFTVVPPQRVADVNSSKRIIVCEYCGRILVSAEFERETPAE